MQNGVWSETKFDDNGLPVLLEKCSECDGRGDGWDALCSRCHNTGETVTPFGSKLLELIGHAKKIHKFYEPPPDDYYE
jgi:hypothetical protein